MTNPSTRSDADRDSRDHAAPIAWATTQTMPYAASPAPSVGAPAVPTPPVGPTNTAATTQPPSTPPNPSTAPTPSRPNPSTAPALNPPVWSGRKTAIAAALAIGISAVGAVGAAAALPVGSTQGGAGQFQPGGFGQQGTPQGTPQGTAQNPNGTQQQFPGQQLPAQAGVPGQGVAPVDPNAAADPNASTT